MTIKIKATGNSDSDIVFNALEKLRKYKAQNKLSPNAPVDEVRIYFPLGGLPFALSAYMDFTGCMNVKSVKLMMDNPGLNCIECLADIRDFKSDWLDYDKTLPYSEPRDATKHLH